MRVSLISVMLCAFAKAAPIQISDSFELSCDGEGTCNLDSSSSYEYPDSDFEICTGDSDCGGEAFCDNGFCSVFEIIETDDCPEDSDVQNSTVSDNIDESTVSDNVEDSTVSDNIDESTVSDNVDNSTVSDVVEDSTISDIVGDLDDTDGLCQTSEDCSENTYCDGGYCVLIDETMVETDSSIDSSAVEDGSFVESGSVEIELDDDDLPVNTDTTVEGTPIVDSNDDISLDDSIVEKNCSWLGHCLGDACETENDCDNDWICSGSRICVPLTHDDVVSDDGCD